MHESETVIAEKNPKVKLKDVQAGLALVHQLREMGLTESGYNLQSPYGPSAVHSPNEGSWNTLKDSTH